MRIIRFLDSAGQIHLGHDYHDAAAHLLTGDLLTGVQPTGQRVAVAKLLAPIQPRAILCVGLNYRRHAAETNAQIPTSSVLFMKNPASINNPGDPIIIPLSCIDPPQVDYEVELAVVIGKTAKNVRREDAPNYVLGYTAANDVSARRWQKHNGGQWCKAKGFDTFCPLGPVLVTIDELTDPQTLRLTSTLNGQMMQDSNTADMIFPVPELIEHLSADTTLLAGTVILTGTPSGVGVARNPMVFMKAGDSITVEIEKIGKLTNPLVNAKE